MQLGFHGVVGLGMARALVRKAPEERASAFTTGLVLGSLLPDLDIYPTAVVTLCCGDAAAHGIHRSATHSLLLIGILVAASYMPSAWKGIPWFLRGLAAGIATHLVADYFMWFAQLDLFWPFSHLPGLAAVLRPLHEGAKPPSVRVFGNPDFVKNIREAVEFAAFACFFLALARVAARGPSVGSVRRRLVFWERIAWVCFVVALGAGIRAPYKLVMPLVVGPWLLVFTPLSWIYTIRLRDTIAEWALSMSGASPPRHDEPATVGIEHRSG